MAAAMAGPASDELGAGAKTGAAPPEPHGGEDQALSEADESREMHWSPISNAPPTA